MLYVMQVLTGNETMVMQMLTSFLLRADEEVFSPTYEREKRIHGKTQLISSRMFPGYLFIHSTDVMNLFVRIHLVKDRHFMQTLTKLLRTDTVFSPISKKEEHDLYALLGEEELPVTKNSHNMAMSRGIIRDGKVIILSGPLVGKEDSIIRVDRHKKLAILSIHLMGRELEFKYKNLET